MSSKAGSSIGAFLMSLPVSAMLLMMVFGVPKFAPGTNGESGWDQARQFLDRLRGDSGPPADEMFRDYPPGAGRPGNPDPFASVARGPGSEPPRWGVSAAPPAGSSNAPGTTSSVEAAADASWPFGQPLASHAAGVSGASVSRADAGGPSRGAFETTGTALTWTDARRRLADLGIQQFHLEPGSQRDQYLFVCMFSPGDETRITQRFEAEATDPLAAVQKVLVQIDAWLAQRHAQRHEQVVQPIGFGP